MKIKLLLFACMLIILSSTVLAVFTMGEPPEEVEVKVQPQLNLEEITGNAVAENSDGTDAGYIFFLISLIIVLIAAFVFLFQRVNPNK